MHVIDLEGNKYPLQATTTNDYELNGNQSLSLRILSTKVNKQFIGDISEMWRVVDHDNVTHKVVYLRKRGIGSKMYAEIKGIPLFFDEFDNDRIYEEYNEHMTASRCFNLIFAGTNFNVALIDNFNAIQWEGFGKGDTKLELFKRALNRYGAEFRIQGNTIYLETLIGRDTSIMYRHRLNASEIVEETDANEFYTYAKGYGDYEDDEESGGYENANLIRDYVSPLESALGIRRRHAPPIMDGRITDRETMDKNLKKLVDESLQVSITATINDLREHGYDIARAQVGDRVFLIDERIDLNTEIRAIKMTLVRNWKGKVIDIDITFGSPSLTERHQSNLSTSTRAITELLAGFRQLPYNALDSATRTATSALHRALTELIFDNGIIARDKNDPNRLVLFNSEGIGISDNGGHTFREAITADGFVLTAGAIGKLSANHIEIGPGTDFAEGYDPTEIVVDLEEFEEYVEDAFKDGIIQESEAIAIGKYLNTLEAEKEALQGRVDSLISNPQLEGVYRVTLEESFYDGSASYMARYNELISSINDAIADGKTNPDEKEAVDQAFDYYSEYLSTILETIEWASDSVTTNKVSESDGALRQDLKLEAPLPTFIQMNNDGITAHSLFELGEYARLDYRGLFVSDGGAIQIGGGLPDNQIASSNKWNTQGTYIDNRGIYTGTITANQVSVGWNNISRRVKISSTGLETYSGLQRTSLLDHRGQRFYRDERHVGNIGTSNWVDRPNYRGLSFQMAEGASYMAWSHDDDGDGTYTIKLVWHMDDTINRKGFDFQDDVNLSNGATLGWDAQASLKPYNNAVSLYFGDQEIVLFENGNVSFRTDGTSNHTFFASGTKNGGHVKVDGKKLGMSPVDSPQVLIEYIEFNVDLSPFGTKVILDEKYLKAINEFAVFPNNGEVVEKGDNYVILKGEGVADIRFVGQRKNYEDVFWGVMGTIEDPEVMQVARNRERKTVLDGETGEMYRLRNQ